MTSDEVRRKAAPGWYKTRDGRKRYWDGAKWTDQFQTPDEVVEAQTPVEVVEVQNPAEVVETQTPAEAVDSQTPTQQQAPAGWYPVGDGSERYWDGAVWTDQTRPGASAAPPSAAVATEPAKKRRRIFLWFFLAVQVLFIVWIIAGMSSTGGEATDCGGLDQETCEAAEDVGAGIGVFLIFIFWIMVDFLLGVAYAIYRLAKRP